MRVDTNLPEYFWFSEVYIKQALIYMIDHV